MKYAIVLSVLILGISCTRNKQAGLEGLWQVEKVTVGDKVRTPIGKWIRFKADFTQESGNGWYQHSIGKWKLNSACTELMITSENGLKDTYGSFEINIIGNEMTWKRNEDGAEVNAALRRITKIPVSNRDEIMGIWKLEKDMLVNNNELNEDAKMEKYLFFKWDRKFVKGLDDGKIFGVYSIHGHKPEIQLIPHDDEIQREFWKFSIKNNKLKMSSLKSDVETTKVYTRTDEFPN